MWQLVVLNNFYFDVAPFSGEASATGAGKLADVVVAGASVHARRRHAFVVLHLAMVASVA